MIPTVTVAGSKNCVFPLSMPRFAWVSQSILHKIVTQKNDFYLHWIWSLSTQRILYLLQSKREIIMSKKLHKNTSNQSDQINLKFLRMFIIRFRKCNYFKGTKNSQSGIFPWICDPNFYSQSAGPINDFLFL